MNGIVIKGMKMPTSCSDCGQFRWDINLQTDVCRIAEAIGGDGIFQSENEGIHNRPQWCPITPYVIDEVKNMKEYIRRENAILACFDGWNNNAQDCAENIRLIPAADVVEVVRCRDCKYYHKETDGYEMCDNSECYDHITSDGFCAWAVRLIKQEVIK